MTRSHGEGFENYVTRGSCELNSISNSPNTIEYKSSNKGYADYSNDKNAVHLKNFDGIEFADSKKRHERKGSKDFMNIAGIANSIKNLAGFGGGHKSFRESKKIEKKETRFKANDDVFYITPRSKLKETRFRSNDDVRIIPPRSKDNINEEQDEQEIFTEITLIPRPVSAKRKQAQKRHEQFLARKNSTEKKPEARKSELELLLEENDWFLNPD